MKKTAAIIILFSFFAITLLSESCMGSSQNKEPAAEDSAVDYIALGMSHVMETKTLLSKNLIEAINSGGAEYAIGFCNTEAITLTDSMTLLTGAEIKRVTDKPRNPQNLANEIELAYITEMKTAQEQGQHLKPIMHESMGKMIAYYPIEINSMCLQCHGIKENDIKADVMSMLNSLYPNDKATGYIENQIRGIWVVEMEKSR